MQYLLLTSLLWCANACKKEKADTEVQLRILNSTVGTISDCRVNPGSNTYNYGQVHIDSFSAYHTFSRAYRYGSIVLTMNGNTYSLQPYDYVGEEPLANGKYTYRLTFSTNNGLDITLIKD